MSSSAGQKWLIGCGVGCLLVALVFIAVVTGGVMFVRDTVSGFEAAVETRAELEKKFGTTDEFTPWPGGEIPADRIETFLAVRQGTELERQDLAENFAAIPMSETEARELESKPSGEKALSIFKIIGSAMGLGGEMGDFFMARNVSLLNQDMGMGEYSYLYAVIYYSWLGHARDEGPQTGRDENDRVDVQFGQPRTDSRARDDLLSMLRNQLRQDESVASDEWTALLTAEIEAMERDSRRYPWRDGLPPSIEESLEPHRGRLEASYDPISNMFELVITEKEGWSVTAE
jgi:hypothetical protein